MYLNFYRKRSSINSLFQSINLSSSFCSIHVFSISYRNTYALFIYLLKKFLSFVKNWKEEKQKIPTYLFWLSSASEKKGKEKVFRKLGEKFPTPALDS